MEPEFKHTRTSDPILLDLLSSVKMINSKQDTLSVDLGEVKKLNDAIRDRITRVESHQEEMNARIKDTRTFLAKHAEDEEKMIMGQGERILVLEDKVNAVERGFPKNGDGERDPRSHADSHESDDEKKKDFGALLQDIRKWIVLSFLAAIGTGIFYLVVTGTKVELTKVVKEQSETTPKEK